jgi:hypothetical protein
MFQRFFLTFLLKTLRRRPICVAVDCFVKALYHKIGDRYYELLYYFRKSSRSSVAVTKHTVVGEEQFSKSMTAALDALLDFPSEAHCLQRW